MIKFWPEWKLRSLQELYPIADNRDLAEALDCHHRTIENLALRLKLQKSRYLLPNQCGWRKHETPPNHPTHTVDSRTGDGTNSGGPEQP